MQLFVNPELKPRKVLTESGTAFDSVYRAEDGDDSVVFGGSVFVAAELAILRRIALRNERGGE